MTSAIHTCSRAETTIDFAGHIAVLMFTRGCNFRCGYCHNPELWELSGENMDYDALGSVLSHARENWVDGVCITGGEPLMQQAIVETAAFIKRAGFSLKIDTQGSFPEALAQVLPYCDYIAMDYKISLDHYPEVIHVAVDPNLIRQSLNQLCQGDVDYEVRTTIVPGLLREEHLRQMCRELTGIKRFVLQPFIPRGNLPDPTLRQADRTPVTQLEEYARLCEDFFDEVLIR